MAELSKKKKRSKQVTGATENGNKTSTDLINTRTQPTLNKKSKPSLKPEAKKSKHNGNAKIRLETESDYIKQLLSLVRLPSSKPSADDQESDSEDKVTLDPTRSRKDLFVSQENRAKSHQELKERFARKLKEVQDSEGKAGPEASKKVDKLTKAAKRMERKKKAKEALKKGLTKAAMPAGNLNKGNPDAVNEGVLPKEDPDQPGNFVYSKLDFVEPVKGTKALQKKNLDPKAALEKIKRSKEKIKDMKAKGQNDKVERVESKIAWENAMDKISGVKVKDDVELLKKSLRRKEGLKKKRAAAWEERKEHVEKKKEDAQTKRKANLKKRKDHNKDQSKKLSIKRGRLIPGI